MVINYTCNDCGSVITVTPKLIGERIEMMVTPCKFCISRRAMRIFDTEWLKKRTEREAGL